MQVETRCDLQEHCNVFFGFIALLIVSKKTFVQGYFNVLSDEMRNEMRLNEYGE